MRGLITALVALVRGFLSRIVVFTGAPPSDDRTETERSVEERPVEERPVEERPSSPRPQSDHERHEIEQRENAAAGADTTLLAGSTASRSESGSAAAAEQRSDDGDIDTPGTPVESERTAENLDTTSSASDKFHKEPHKPQTVDGSDRETAACAGISEDIVETQSQRGAADSEGRATDSTGCTAPSLDILPPAANRIPENSEADTTLLAGSTASRSESGSAAAAEQRSDDGDIDTPGTPVESERTAENLDTTSSASDKFHKEPHKPQTVDGSDRETAACAGVSEDIVETQSQRGAADSEGRATDSTGCTAPSPDILPPAANRIPENTDTTPDDRLRDSEETRAKDRRLDQDPVQLPSLPELPTELSEEHRERDWMRALNQERTRQRKQTRAATETSRAPLQPAPPEDAREYRVLVTDIAATDAEYSQWNSAVTEQILLARPVSEPVYLCITPRTLATAFAKAGNEELEPKDAEERFGAAVASVYRGRVLRYSEHLRILRRCGNDGTPDCVAFLAASVLAAYRMQFDEELSGSAYYRRLSDLLACPMSGAHPIGFNPIVFESLWVFLRNWLQNAHHRRLAEPQSEIGFRRFVAFPLAHVPLRSLDIEKLPAFFAWAGYEPTSRIRSDRLLRDLKRWQSAKTALTNPGAEALLDHRSDAVVAQVAAELESWDGSFSDSASRRSAVVEVQFDVVQRKPILAYLPRRPSGFPTVFSDGDHVFEASETGWYEPEPIHRTDGDLLARGFEWRSGDRIQYVLRRSSTSAIALTPSFSYSGLISSRRLLRGTKCSVLCKDEVTVTVVDYLSDVAQKRLNPLSHPLLPEGWSIIRDFTASVYLEPPPGLEALEVDPNVGIVISGGLRIGRRWSWLAGAPPRILVSGAAVEETVRLDGVPVLIPDDGELRINGKLDHPGEYLIEAGRIRRRIEIASAQLPAEDAAGASPDGIGKRRPVTIALPQGVWTLIGASPGEVSHQRIAGARSAICSSHFLPVWALQVGAGPGARVLVLAKPEPPKTLLPRKPKVSLPNGSQQWASAIYAAHIRRPQFNALDGVAIRADVERVWKQYAAAAKRIKAAPKRK